MSYASPRRGVSLRKASPPPRSPANSEPVRALGDAHSACCLERPQRAADAAKRGAPVVVRRAASGRHAMRSSGVFSTAAPRVRASPHRPSSSLLSARRTVSPSPSSALSHKQPQRSLETGCCRHARSPLNARRRRRSVDAERRCGAEWVRGGPSGPPRDRDCGARSTRRGSRPPISWPATVPYCRSSPGCASGQRYRWRRVRRSTRLSLRSPRRS